MSYIETVLLLKNFPREYKIKYKEGIFFFEYITEKYACRVEFIIGEFYVIVIKIECNNKIVYEIKKNIQKYNTDDEKLIELIDTLINDVESLDVVSIVMLKRFFM